MQNIALQKKWKKSPDNKRKELQKVDDLDFDLTKHQDKMSKLNLWIKNIFEFQMTPDTKIPLETKVAHQACLKMDIFKINDPSS